MKLNQYGAIFGIDARITLAIFSGLTVIAGYNITTNMDYITGGALTDELKNLSNAVDGYHHDLKQDIFKTLITPSEENAVRALYNIEEVENGRYRARWLGPYVQYNSTTHPRYGKIRLEKRAGNVKDTCKRHAGTCYLWATLSKVPNGTVDKVNDDYDGDELTPDITGKVQWQVGDNKDGEYKKLWFRISRTIQ